MAGKAEMEKQAEIRIFTEELWQNITAMMAGSDLSRSDLMRVWRTIHGRILCLPAEDGDETPANLEPSTTQS